MAIDDSDPHFAVGFDHGYCDAPAYRWQYPHHQERYEAGYHAGRETRRRDQATLNSVSISNFEKLARQMQNSRQTFQQAPGWRTKP